MSRRERQRANRHRKRREKALDRIYESAVLALENKYGRVFPDRIPVRSGKTGFGGGHLYSVSDPVPAEVWKRRRRREN